jgi:serine/threonine protein kinase
MIDRFAARVYIAMMRNDAKLAKTIYDDAIELPLTATCKELASDYDIIVDKCVYGDNIVVNDHLQICFKDGKPSILKKVSSNEYERAQALVAAKLKHAHLVDLQPIQLERKRYVVMPLLPITVVMLCGMNESKAVELWDQISSALEYLHANHYGHKDIKPENICVNSEGKFILIDMGETVAFGQCSGSTSKYVPSDLDGAAPATARLDWGMLAMTIYDRMQIYGEGVSFSDKSMTTEDLMSWFRRKSFTTLYNKIRAKLEDDVR